MDRPACWLPLGWTEKELAAAASRVWDLRRELVEHGTLAWWTPWFMGGSPYTLQHVAGAPAARLARPRARRRRPRRRGEDGRAPRHRGERAHDVRVRAGGCSARPWAAAVAAVAYALHPQQAFRAGGDEHVGLSVAFALVPLVWLTWSRATVSGSARSAFLAALALTALLWTSSRHVLVIGLLLGIATSRAAGASAAPPRVPRSAGRRSTSLFGAALGAFCIVPALEESRHARFFAGEDVSEWQRQLAFRGLLGLVDRDGVLTAPAMTAAEPVAVADPAERAARERLSLLKFESGAKYAGLVLLALAAGALLVGRRRADATLLGTLAVAFVVCMAAATGLDWLAQPRISRRCARSGGVAGVPAGTRVAAAALPLLAAAALLAARRRRRRGARRARPRARGSPSSRGCRSSGRRRAARSSAASARRSCSTTSPRRSCSACSPGSSSPTSSRRAAGARDTAPSRWRSSRWCSPTTRPRRAPSGRSPARRAPPRTSRRRTARSAARAGVGQDLLRLDAEPAPPRPDPRREAAGVRGVDQVDEPARDGPPERAELDLAAGQPRLPRPGRRALDRLRQGRHDDDGVEARARDARLLPPVVSRTPRERQPGRPRERRRVAVAQHASPRGALPRRRPRVAGARARARRASECRSSTWTAARRSGPSTSRAGVYVDRDGERRIGEFPAPRGWPSRSARRARAPPRAGGRRSGPPTRAPCGAATATSTCASTWRSPACSSSPRATTRTGARPWTGGPPSVARVSCGLMGLGLGAGTHDVRLRFAVPAAVLDRGLRVPGHAGARARGSAPAT